MSNLDKVVDAAIEGINLQFTREVELRCKACGCFVRQRMRIKEPLTGELWNIIKGIGALTRVGGCDYGCLCHVESREDQHSFSVTFGPAIRV